MNMTEDNKYEIINNLKEIKVLIDVIVAVGNNSIIFNELIPGLKSRLNLIYEKVLSYKETKLENRGSKRFDIVRENGNVELNLMASSVEKLYDIFRGEKIQILRVIDEYGVIIEEHERKYAEWQYITPEDYSDVDTELIFGEEKEDDENLTINENKQDKTNEQILHKNNKTRRTKNGKNTRKSHT
jgi:hypothetical protein